MEVPQSWRSKRLLEVAWCLQCLFSVMVDIRIPCYSVDQGIQVPHLCVALWWRGLGPDRYSWDMENIDIGRGRNGMIHNQRPPHPMLIDLQEQESGAGWVVTISQYFPGGI